MTYIPQLLCAVFVQAKLHSPSTAETCRTVQLNRLYLQPIGSIHAVGDSYHAVDNICDRTMRSSRSSCYSPMPPHAILMTSTLFADWIHMPTWWKVNLRLKPSPKLSTTRQLASVCLTVLWLFYFRPQTILLRQFSGTLDKIHSGQTGRMPTLERFHFQKLISLEGVEQASLQGQRMRRK